MLARPPREHGLTLPRLAHVVGRCREVEDDLRTRGRKPCHRFVDPDVLADGDRTCRAADADDDIRGSSAEVALFVEDAVVGQQPLVIDSLDATVTHERSGVAHPADGPRQGGLGHAVDETDDRGYGRTLRELGHCLDGAVHEVGPGEQVLGRVAREHELGEEHDVRARGALGGAKAALEVAPDVPDHGVDLCECYLHSPSLALATRRRGAAQRRPRLSLAVRQ